MSSSNTNWEDELNIGDSDLPLTPALHPCKSQAPQTLIIKSTQKLDRIDLVESTPVPVRLSPAGVLQVEGKPVRIIHGPAGVLQLAKMRKHSDIQLVGDDSVLSTQEYMQLVVQDVGDDADFSSGPWVGATEYIKLYGVQVSGCLGDVKTFLKNEKLELVVGIIKSCSPNVLGDRNVTVKDLSGTLPG